MLDENKLRRILHVGPEDLRFVLDNLDRYYYAKSFPKLGKDGFQLTDRSGRPRTRNLYPSVRELKTIQHGILRNILKRIPLPAYAFGGIKKRDNILNAKMHQGNKYFFTTDLRNFYPLISHHMVFETFVACGFGPGTAHLLTKLTTYKGQLPQGTHSSPYLANLVFVKCGKRLEEFAKANQLTFTTFVDDLTFSGKLDFQEKGNEIIAIINEYGFTISHNKTFYQTKNPKVTNVIVRRDGLDLDEKYKEKAAGFEGKETPEAKGTINYLNRVVKIGQTKTAKIKKQIEQG